MSDAKKGKFAVNVERRRWDLQEYERKALEEARQKATNDTPVVAKAPLRAREATPVSLSATLGKSVLVAANTPLAARGGYYCDVCTCLLKDSQTYLDHINGRKHQKRLGMSMKVGQAGLDDVRDRLRQWTDRKESEDKGREKGRKRKRDGGRNEAAEAGNRANEEEDESEPDSGDAGTAESKDRTKEAGDEANGAFRPAELDRTADDDEEVMMAAMGFKFSGFGGSKKT